MRLRCFCILLSVALSTPAVSDGYPIRDLAVREAVELPVWRFKPVTAGVTDEDWSTPDLRAERESWPTVSLPAVWDRGPGTVSGRTPDQAGWFRAVVEIPSAWTGDVELCFLAVKFTADVFVDGDYRLTHRGGYTPFRVPLGSAENLPDEVEVVVRVDNRLSQETVPKGRVGWETFGGIDREVYLLHRPPSRPENLVVRTLPKGDGAWSLSMTADVVGTPGDPLDITLSLDGDSIASTRVEDWSEGLKLDLPVDDPALWSPERPTLHTLTLTWGGDRLSFPVGFRELAWRDGHLYVNGERTWLQGFGQHEAWPDAGHIGTPAQRRRDLLLMKHRFHANAIRPGHYPNHPELYNLADELGLLVFSEIPVWQNHAHLLATDAAWETWLEPQLREMVELTRNHPSVMAWGVLNETGGAHAYVTRARAFLQDRNPDRPVAAVLDRDRDPDIASVTDLLARNLHYGWYHSRSVYALRAALESSLASARGKPLWIAELGGMSTRGRIGDNYGDDARGTELYQEKMVRFGLQHVMSRADELAGISLWTFSDFHPNPHGLFTLDRKPKLAAYPVANLMRPGLVVLARENERRVAPGGELRVDLALFSRAPSPGRTLAVDWRLRRGGEVLRQGSKDATLGPGWVTELEPIAWTAPSDAAPGLLHFQAEILDGRGERLHSIALPIELGSGGGFGILRLAPPPGDQPEPVTVMDMPMTAWPEIGLQLALPAGEVDLRRGADSRSVTIRAGQATEVEWR